MGATEPAAPFDVTGKGPAAIFDPTAVGKEFGISFGAVTAGYTNPLGDSLKATVTGPELEVGTSGVSASLINGEGELGAQLFGGAVTASANVGLDVSTHLWTGQEGQYGAEIMGMGGNVQMKPDGTECATIETSILGGSVCASGATIGTIGSAGSDFANDLARGFDVLTNDPSGAAQFFADEVSQGLSSLWP